MKVEDFLNILGEDFFVGVPDSQLKPLCNYLNNTYGIDKKHHIIAANEGNCVAIATGYHLATGKTPVVYMQNSGEGNIVNPVASLLNSKVYNIPMIFIIGWRGEPNTNDEPQHKYQGEITLKLLDVLEIEYTVISKDTDVEELRSVMEKRRKSLSEGKNVAFVIRKGAFSYEKLTEYKNAYTLKREEVIEHIVAVSGEDMIISTTGKASRELFEIREKKHQGHARDFLTVGSMGHSSSIALGISLARPDKRIWCIDGDGAVLMHMGAMALIGANRPHNLLHIVLNNGAHETVGGMPTVANDIDLVKIAEGCGYQYVASVDNMIDLDKELQKMIDMHLLCFLEVKCALGARSDLGRPTTGTVENKVSFMKELREN